MLGKIKQKLKEMTVSFAVGPKSHGGLVIQEPDKKKKKGIPAMIINPRGNK